MGNATRGSATGSDAMIINPAGLSYQHQFEVEPIYQYDVQRNTHGMGAFISDSLNSPRFALGLGYVFTSGSPVVRYTDPVNQRSKLKLSYFGHEVGGVVSVAVIKNFLFVAAKPKWQYVSLRYRDALGTAVNFAPKLNTFGIDASMAINLFEWVKIAATGYNLYGSSRPAWTQVPPETLEGIEESDDPDINVNNLRQLSDYPLSLGHGIAVFPLRSPRFSLNFDALYDFSSFRTDTDNWTRITVNGGGEFIAGPVPIRVGGYWDSRGRGQGDDRGYVSGGVGFYKPAGTGGGTGVDIGFAFSQQVTGAAKASELDTVISINVGILLRPNL